MRQYELKSPFPDWHFEPATPRQLKLLKFFGEDITNPLTKGRCSGVIGRLFADPVKKKLWAAYVFTTGDEFDTSTELQPHDLTVLEGVIIPKDWHPGRSSGSTSPARKALDELISNLLKEGSPFDDPLPLIKIAGTTFCFTGKFLYGKRQECQDAVITRGGMITDNVNSTTNVLVIGNDANPNWSHGSYGNKIADAMILRMNNNVPNIIPEAYWSDLLSE
jgi:hypothetical protein